MSKETKKRILKSLENRKDIEDVLRENAINIAKFHKKYCKGGDCNISLELLRELLTGKHEIKLTFREEHIFI